MTRVGNGNGSFAYQAVGTQTGVASADPHRLIQMLMDGAIARLATARGGIERGDGTMSADDIGRAIAIIDGLRVSLDGETGGQIAENLGELYDYMIRRLLLATVHRDGAIVDEIAGLLRELRGAWDAIRPAALGSAGRSVPAELQPAV